MARPATVIGIGEPLRGDDGVGPRVVRALRGRLPPEVVLVERAEPTALLELWSGASMAVVVDAGVTGAPAGTVTRLEGADLRRAAGRPGTSSHGLSVASAFALGEPLGRLPERLVVFLVEAGAFVPGAPLGSSVEAGAEAAARAIVDELAHPSGVLG